MAARVDPVAGRCDSHLPSREGGCQQLSCPKDGKAWACQRPDSDWSVQKAAVQVELRALWEA
eukprot:4512546-Prorocentrum_lima.AAC.1